MSSLFTVASSAVKRLYTVSFQSILSDYQKEIILEALYETDYVLPGDIEFNDFIEQESNVTQLDIYWSAAVDEDDPEQARMQIIEAVLNI